MDVMIVCQSGTGNTRLGAEAMGAEFEAAGHNCTIVSVRDAQPDRLAAAHVIGVAAPVHGFRPARNVLRFVNSLPELRGKQGFVLCCCSAVAANSVRTLWQALGAKGVRVLGGHTLIGEDSWPFLRLGPLTPGRGCPSPDGLERVREFARGIVARAAELDSPAPRAPAWWPSPFHFIGLLATQRTLRWMMLGKRVDASRCTRCGKCVEVCPTGAIEMQDVPKFTSACTGCFACINNCPERAINCPMSWGRSLYRGPQSAD